MKIERNTGNKAFLNEKFIQISLCRGLRRECVYFLPRGGRLASDLKELRVNFEANLSTRAELVFQKFCKNCLEESIN